MFPPTFAFDAVQNLTEPGELVLDPFCGRGNGPYTASVLGRPSVGIDVNPLAWLFTQGKLRPARTLARVLDRLSELGRACRTADRKGQNRFERMAWSPAVRSFLRTARRELDWQANDVDCTLMGFITLHMQDKVGSGLSNHLWPTIACSPAYAVKWWTNNGLCVPPDVDPVAVLTDKIRRRYAYQTPDQADGRALLGDATEVLRDEDKCMEAGLLLTSPPYIGVTDYWNDHWIRLWMLGHPLRKNWKKAAKFGNRASYEALLRAVFLEARRHVAESAPVLVRSDQRRHTATICGAALQAAWPGQNVFTRATAASKEGVSRHHGRGGRLAKEMDLLLLARSDKRRQRWAKQHGFVEARSS